MSPRVRFAPSPTGLLHVGALRTAVFNSLLAKRHGGVNILRIEDTDRTRYNPESEQEFIDTLAWVGISFDEGPHVAGPHSPYRQSERKEAGIYRPYVDQLLASGHAYKAFDTPEELAEMRQFQEINRTATGYFGGEWRDADAAKVAEAEAAGKPYVVRLKIPRGETIVLNDVIRGRIEWDSNTIDDPVLIKADGMPTYHFAAMVDDHIMEITHVLRGEEWISSAPKHLALFSAFGWEPPVFVHCPVIVGNDGKKLSKRHGATRVLDYAAQGYLPDPLINFVALIGWSPGDDREIMSRDELTQAFDLKGLQPSPGRFDLEKLNWINGAAIRALSIEQLVSAIKLFLQYPYTFEYWDTVEAEAGQADPRQIAADLRLLQAAMLSDEAYATAAIQLEQERVQTLAGFGSACAFFFHEEPEYDQKAVDKWFGEPHVRPMLTHFRDAMESMPEATVEAMESLVRNYAASNGFEKLGPVVHPTRVALTGKTVGPGLFELMSVLGPARCMRRLERSLGLVQ